MMLRHSMLSADKLSIMKSVFANNHKHHFEIGPNAMLGVEAPTGAGKSTGLYEIVSKNPGLYKKTLFIFPTHVSKMAIAKNKVSHIVACTPKNAIPQIIRWSNISTIVVDEAHFPSKEYYSIYKILSKIREAYTFRVIFLSATLDREFILDFFPDTQFVSLEKPVASHNIDIRYLDNFQASWYPNYNNIADAMMNVLTRKINPDDHNKVLCFMATHEQCERLRARIKKVFPDREVVTLHGGMTPEEIEETRTLMDQADQFVCIATNIVETAITLRGINYVLDSGIRCVVQGSIVITTYCDQVSMIQRAGRTGRTNDGIVYRIMSQQKFESLAFQEYPVHNFDHIVLQLYNLNVNPFHYLDQHATSSIQRFTKYGLLENGRPPYHVARFLEQCGLEIRNGLTLYRFLSIHNTYPEDVRGWIIMAIAIMNYYDSKMPQLIYFPDKCNRNAIILKIRSRFLINNDMVLTIMNILFTVFMSEDPKKMAMEYSFNFRTLREMASIFRRIFSICYPTKKHDWKSCKPFKPDGRRLTQFQWFFRMDPNLSIAYIHPALRDHDHPIYVRGDHITTIIYSSTSIILPLVSKVTEDLTEIFTEVYLFMRIQDYREDRTGLKNHFRMMTKHRDEKLRWKKEFGSVLCDVMDDVAYRPGQYRIHEKWVEFNDTVKAFLDTLDSAFVGVHQ